jgi:hypothetical protein
MGLVDGGHPAGIGGDSEEGQGRGGVAPDGGPVGGQVQAGHVGAVEAGRVANLLELLIPALVRQPAVGLLQQALDGGKQLRQGGLIDQGRPGLVEMKPRPGPILPRQRVLARARLLPGPDAHGFDVLVLLQLLLRGPRLGLGRP